MVPRLTEAQRNAIDTSNDSVANSLLIYNTDEDCYNYYSRLNGEWQSLCGKPGKAVFTIDCSGMKVHGQYLNGASLDAMHYIETKVNVTKPGAYSIMAIPDPENGYYFSATGEFFSQGIYHINLTGAGTPTAYGNNTVEIFAQGVKVCDMTIKVEDSSIKPEYEMLCSEVKALGVYVKNRALGAQNKLRVILLATPAAAGATWIIETNTVNGIRFAGSGVLAGGPQVVELQGYGKPTSTDPITLTLSSNSSITVETCPVRIAVAYSQKKVLAYGHGNGFGYNLSAGAGSSGLLSYGGRKMLLSPFNFGTESYSKIKCEPIVIVAGSATETPNPTELGADIRTHRPDIIILGYNSALTGAAVDTLIKYLDNRGIVLAFIENGNATERLFNRVLNLTGITAESNGTAGTIYQFSYIAGDKSILNGPFGDIREKYWGEDASTTQSVKGVPAGMVDILSLGKIIHAGYSSTDRQHNINACKFKNQNLVWVGDGGFFSRGQTDDAVNSNTICPLYYNSYFQPITGNFGYASGNYTIYNSFFFANLFAWALKEAEFNGYNTP
jgi:hypothetical protein